MGDADQLMNFVFVRHSFLLDSNEPGRADDHCCGSAAINEKAAPRGSGFRNERRRFISCAIHRRLRRFDVVDGDLAGAAVFSRVEGNLLAFDEVAHAGALESGGMDEHVLAAVGRLDEAEALHVVVEFYSARNHRGNLSRWMQMHVSEGTQKRGLNSVRRCNGKKVRTCAWKDQKRNDPIVRPKSDNNYISVILDYNKDKTESKFMEKNSFAIWHNIMEPEATVSRVQPHFSSRSAFALEKLKARISGALGPRLGRDLSQLLQNEVVHGTEHALTIL